MAVTVSPAELKNLEDVLLNTSGNVLLHNRFRALFTLKSFKSEEAIQIISKGFQDESALLKHELAYCLGQIQSTTALPMLESVLANTAEDPMVRHEAAEAMGAISSATSVPILKQYLSDDNESVRDTCEIAIARIEWDNSEEGKRHLSSVAHLRFSVYTSIDPAPPTSGLLSGALKPEDLSDSNIEDLKNKLLDRNLPLFVRYRAMFALRNIGTSAAVDALAAGFYDDSALFKHEIAFVFGQLLSPHSDSNESEMVRHEAAEALGGIATPEALPVLREWMTRQDAPRVVRESCQVAIDMWEVCNSYDSTKTRGIQYANGLDTVAAAA
ncbi:ARM repeat-containing protein [Hymenopellis radicata]|nr:ARM repeat-containing protein [Hymenopellis radicata]